jgi:hypothetical protein
LGYCENSPGFGKLGLSRLNTDIMRIRVRCHKISPQHPRAALASANILRKDDQHAEGKTGRI